MKKSKFITGLSAAFISAMALMSCSSLLKAKDGVILTIDGVPYTAEELFEDQKTPAAAEAKFNAVYKVAVRTFFLKGHEGAKFMNEITNDTKIKISEQKAIAQSNAEKSGTSYAEEWQKILDSNNVDNESELYDKFEYDLQKEKYEDNFYEENYDGLRQGNPFEGIEGTEDFVNYLDGKQPYHIKHILVKISAKAGDGATGEITAKEAKNIGNVIKNLAAGDDFSEVSDDFNEDTTAKDNKGSLGIMSRDTSFVNDFKLGIYMYESFFGTSTQSGSSHLYKQSAIESLKLNGGAAGGKKAADYALAISQIADPTSEKTTAGQYNGLGQIPYEAAENLVKYADYDFSGETQDSKDVIKRFSDAGIASDKVAAKFLPRNVLFNKYFNKHNIMVITPRKLHTYASDTNKLKEWTSNGKTRTNKKDNYLGTFNSTLIDDPATPDVKEGLPGFNREAKNEDILNFNFTDETGAAITNDNVLRDENGRVILVFRSGTGDSSSNDAYQGIHFVVIERSPFIGKENETDEKGVKYDVDLNQYYTHYYPNQPGGEHPTYTDASGNKHWMKTFVNYFPNLVQIKDLKERADTVKSEIKKCDSKLDTYLYQLVEKDIVWSKKAQQLGIKDSIDNWIEISRTSERIEKNRTWNETWEEYYYSLESQTEQREEEADATTVHSKLVPEACAVTFFSDDTYLNGIKLSDLFGEGGLFHE